MERGRIQVDGDALPESVAEPQIGATSQWAVGLLERVGQLKIGASDDLNVALTRRG
jgi:hypothetical protein